MDGGNIPPSSRIKTKLEIRTRRLGKTSHPRIRMLNRFCDAGNVTVKSSHCEMAKSKAERQLKAAFTFNWRDSGVHPISLKRYMDSK